MARKNDLRKIKYNAILQVWGDPKLARQYRDKSWENINYDLGVKETNKLITPKPITKEVRVKRQEQLKTYQRSFEQLTTVIPFASPEKVRADIQRRYKPNTIAKRYSMPTEEKTRRDFWASWSKQEDLPISLKRLAIALNKRNGYDKRDSYGYIIVYNSYVNEKSYTYYENRYQQIGYTRDQYVIVGRS
jgi:hypothetical protein